MNLVRRATSKIETKVAVGRIAGKASRMSGEAPHVGRAVAPGEGAAQHQSPQQR